MPRAKPRPLTEHEWDLVFRARCRSKEGKVLTEAEHALIDAAWRSDPRRYGELSTEVFKATMPFGARGGGA